MSSLEINFTFVSPEETEHELNSKMIIFCIKEKEEIHFYCQYSREYFEIDLQTVFFVFEKTHAIHLFFKKIFDNININYDILKISHNLKSLNKIVFQDVLIHDLSYKTVFFNFENNLKILKDFNISTNTKIFKEILIKNTKNSITDNLPSEIIDMICNLI